MKRKFVVIGRAAVLVFAAFMLILFGGVVVLLFLRYEEVATAYVAFSTLILAIVTVVLARLSWLSIKGTEGRERRVQSQRNRDDIRRWVEEAAKGAVSRQTRAQSELWEARLKYKYSLATGAYIDRITESFPNLVPYVSAVADRLEHAITVTTQVIEKSVENGGTALVECENQVREATERLLSELASMSFE